MIVALSRHSRCVFRSGARGECKFLVDGVSVVRPDTLHWTWPWPAVWATALPMTASCLSTLSEFESLLGAWKIDALDLKPSGRLVSISSTPSYMRPSRLILDPSQIWAFPACLAKKLTKNENSKFKFKRVPARQRKQGLPTARSHCHAIP